MSSTTVTPPPKLPSAPEQAVILRALGAIALDAAVSDLNGFASRLEQALQTQVAKGGPDAAAWQHAAQHLASQRVNFLRIGQVSLRETVKFEVESLVATSKEKEALVRHAMDLSLNTFAAMERKVLFDNLSQAIERRYSGALTAFHDALALLLQREGMTPAQNPFRPEVFVRAMADAWSRFDLIAAGHRKVLAQFQPEVFLQLEPMYRSLQQEVDAQLASFRMNRHASGAQAQAATLDQRLQARLASASFEEAALLVQNVFEQLRAHVTAEHFVLLLRLQPAVLKLVAADRDALSDGSHPVRRLLDALVRYGSGMDAAGPLAQTMTRIIDRIAGTSSPAAGEFAHLLAVLEAFISRQQIQAGASLRDVIAQATHSERRDALRELAVADVNARMQTGEVAGFVELFLQTQWVRVLAIAHGMRETKPAKLAGLLQAMDDLIWSVKPKTSPEERKELLSRLPSLIALLKVWLDAVKWQGAEREEFFETLAQRHAAVVRTPLESMPRQQLEIAMNIAQKASDHRFSRQATEDAPADPMRSRVDQLVLGDRLQFGKQVSARLAWISPSRGRFVWVRDDGGVPLALTAREIIDALQNRKAAITSDGVLEQALAAALKAMPAA